MPQSTLYFYVLEVLVLVVFVFGLACDVQFWLKGSSGPGKGTSVFRRILELAGELARAFRRDALGTVLLDWFFQRRLLRSNPLSWTVHICFFWGLIVLFFVGSVGLMLAEKGIVPIAKDTPWFAFVNDLAGVAVLFAVVIALYRRFVRREWHLKTAPDDVALIALLSVIVISGYVLEASRFVAQRTPADVGWFGFAGYVIAEALRPLPLDWPRVEVAVWWVHVVGGMSFVAYLPYSKLLHLVAAPLTVIAGSSAPAPARDVAEA